MDDSVNQIARRVMIHQAVDEIVDARREMGVDGTAEALSDALDHLSAVALGEDLTEHAWQAIAAIAQGQLEEALEARENWTDQPPPERLFSQSRYERFHAWLTDRGGSP